MLIVILEEYYWEIERISYNKHENKEINKWIIMRMSNITENLLFTIIRIIL